MAVCNVSVQVLPMVPEERLYEVVDKAIEVIGAAGVKYVVGPLETTMEGELDELLEIVKRAQQACLDAGAKRVCTVVKIDYGLEGVTIAEKTAKYER